MSAPVVEILKVRMLLEDVNLLLQNVDLLGYIVWKKLSVHRERAREFAIAAIARVKYIDNIL